MMINPSDWCFQREFIRPIFFSDLGVWELRTTFFSAAHFLDSMGQKWMFEAKSAKEEGEDEHTLW